MADKNKSKPEVSTKEFTKFIKSVTLISIEIIESNIKKKENFMPPAKIELAQKIEYKEYKTKNKFAAFNTFNLTATKDKQKTKELIIMVKYKCVYSYKDKLNIKYFDKFNKYNLIDCWPYFRHYVQDISLKLKIPPLVLDLQREYRT